MNPLAREMAVIAATTQRLVFTVCRHGRTYPNCITITPFRSRILVIPPQSRTYYVWKQISNRCTYKITPKPPPIRITSPPNRTGSGGFLYILKMAHTRPPIRPGHDCQLVIVGRTALFHSPPSASQTRQALLLTAAGKAAAAPTHKTGFTFAKCRPPAIAPSAQVRG